MADLSDFKIIVKLVIIVVTFCVEDNNIYPEVV